MLAIPSENYTVDELMEQWRLIFTDFDTHLVASGGDFKNILMYMNIIKKHYKFLMKGLTSNSVKIYPYHSDTFVYFMYMFEIQRSNNYHHEFRADNNDFDSAVSENNEFIMKKDINMDFFLKL